MPLFDGGMSHDDVFTLAHSRFEGDLKSPQSANAGFDWN